MGGDEVVVFAAASLEEALTEIGARYIAQRDHVSIVFNFDSSGTLKTQIQEGADCGLFISAGQGQMDQLEAEGFLLDGSRSDLLENTVVLAVPEDNPLPQGRKAHARKYLRRLVGAEKIEKVSGPVQVPSSGEDGSGVDGPSAHLRPGSVHHGQSGGISVGPIDDAAVHRPRRRPGW